MSDANIVALLDEANMADSTLGAAALPKATSNEVKRFAKLMMGEHHALRVQGQQLAKKENITPQMPTNDPFTSAVRNEQTALASTAKGHAFDSTYIANEVGIQENAYPRSDESPDQRVQRQTSENQDLERRYARGKAAHSQTLPPSDAQHHNDQPDKDHR